MNLLAAAAVVRCGGRVLPVGLGLRGARTRPAGTDRRYVPGLTLAVLFGLSMDYQVFLVSRMHEEWAHTHDNPVR